MPFVPCRLEQRVGPLERVVVMLEDDVDVVSCRTAAPNTCDCRRRCPLLALVDLERPKRGVGRDVVEPRTRSDDAAISSVFSSQLVCRRPPADVVRVEQHQADIIAEVERGEAGFGEQPIEHRVEEGPRRGLP